MKPGKYAMRITMLVLFFGIVAYFGIYIYQSLNNIIELEEVHTSTAGDIAEVSGFLVRDEYVIDEAASSLMEVLLNEGEKVAYGGEVALIYSTEEAVERQQEIQSLEEELARLQTISAGNSSSDILALDQEIEDLILQLHKDLADGTYSSLDEDAESLIALILEQNYYSDDDIDLESTITALANEIAVLESSSSSDTRTVTAEVSGTYSGYVDGYEDILTVDTLDTLTPSVISDWEALSASVTAEQYIGKLIAGQCWYYAVVMDADEADRMDDTVTLQFTSDFTDPITMSVEYISDEEDGKVAVVFCTYDYLTQTTTMRYQAAEIVYDEITGIEIPLSALRIESETDEDGTTTTQEGVYVVVGNSAEWKPVNVLYTDTEAGICLVEPTDATDSDALRDGDTVIVKGKNIYEGKVISE